MVLIIKSYKFRLYPSRTQQLILCKMLDIARFAYNKQLELKINTYKKDKTNLRQFDLNNNLITLKEEFSFPEAIAFTNTAEHKPKD